MSSDHRFGYISPDDWSPQELVEAHALIASLRDELLQEARINGMGGEREARLMAIVAEREGQILQLKEAIRRIAAHDATLSVCDGDVLVQMDATLTDAEREAVEVALVWVNPERQDTLRGLLDRLK